MSVNWYAYSTPDDAAAHCAQRVLRELETALDAHRPISMAVSGGSTPRLMFGHLARTRFDWRQVHLFFVDERCVAPTDADSNYRMCEETFIKPAHFPLAHVHRIKAELRPDDAARLYAEELIEFFELAAGELPAFDLIHRGMGPDAHTASLFPGEPLIEDREGICAAVWVPKLSKYRITLLPGVLLNARNTVVLAAGADKADALYDVFNAEHNALQFPSQIDTPHGRNVAWYLDSNAGARLE